MDGSRVAVVASLTVIVGISVLSGPLVGVDFTASPAASVGPDLGEGAIDATVQTLPDTGSLEKGGFGADAYALSIPPATLDVEAVSGQPLVVYTLEVPELGLTHSATYFLSPSNTGSVTMTIDSHSLAPDRIGADSYRGVLDVSVRIGESVRVLDRHNVSIEVVR